jgi:hypothetical protein
MELHQWIFPLDVWRRQQGEDGGEVNASTPVVEEAQANVGATGAGPQYVRGGPGTWPEDRRGTAGGATTLPTTHRSSCSLTIPASRWRWRAAPPSSSPTASSPPSSRPSRPPTAGRAARRGASVVQQYLAAGLVDEFELHIVPVLLGDGERLLENVGDLQVEQVRAVEAPASPTSSTASSMTAETPH